MISEFTCKTKSMKNTRIGVYGVSGAGKSFLLNALKTRTASLCSGAEIVWSEGSEAIEKMVGLGGLQRFKQMDRNAQDAIRIKAIQKIDEDAGNNPAVVVGHYSFLSKDLMKNENISTTDSSETQMLPYDVVMTDADLQVFSHIIYFDANAEKIIARWTEDNSSGFRFRGPVPPIQTVRDWIDFERQNLFQICIRNEILFLPLAAGEDNLINVNDLDRIISDFIQHNSFTNITSLTATAKEALDDLQMAQKGMESLDKFILTIDGDKTLSVEDTAVEYFAQSKAQRISSLVASGFPPKVIFETMGYSYSAFRQAAMMYSAITLPEHLSICNQVAEKVSIHPEWIAFLKRVEDTTCINAVVVTSGIKHVWELLLKKAGLPFKVIGGSVIEDGFVLSAEGKRSVVECFQTFGKVWAFGDSELDLPMLKAADAAFLVQMDEVKKSSALGKVLKECEDIPNLMQIVLPTGALSRINRFPVTTLSWVLNRLESLLTNNKLPSEPHAGAWEGFSSFHDFGSRPASKVLASSMRDANQWGAALRSAHLRAGEYLAHAVVDLLGCEDVSIQHVLGQPAEGFRAKNAQCTTLLALMRGGLPMTLGAAKVFPDAALVMVHDVDKDLRREHIRPGGTVIVIDSVINNGSSVRQAVRKVVELSRYDDSDAGCAQAGARALRTGIRIVVLAGTIQAGAVPGLRAEFGPLGGLVCPLNPWSGVDSVDLVGLRTSSTKFTGSGGNDTGNRLFNTTFLLD